MKTRANEPPILTRAESEIMAVLWRSGGATVHDVVEALERDVAYTSVLTMLRILEKKGYVQHEPHPDGGRAHVYKPLVQAVAARRHHVRDLIDRLFGGQSDELVVGLLEEEKWSKPDLERLRELIDSRLSAPKAAAPARTKKGKGHGA
jgi:BlaI family transcriptional regulator, penicillinase repressor